ncbi:MAG: glycosyltransferase [Lysobacterales bacterium]
MSDLRVSVILCTHNPKAAPLRRVLQALGAQSLDSGTWELLLVDNACQPALSDRVEFADVLADLPVRTVAEPKLGLTPARLRGFSAARANVLVLIDDDTIPNADYLEQALLLFDQHPELGAAGGRIAAEYELTPPSWTHGFLDALAIRDFGDRPIRALIHNTLGPWEPCGAGMVLRRSVAQAYINTAYSSERLQLDRVGQALTSCGDTDLARTASDLGLYLAYEPALRLTHLIPGGRLRLSYLMRLTYSIQRDGHMLLRMRGDRTPMAARAYLLRLVQAPFSTVSLDPRRWMLRLAARLGQLVGRRAPLESAR